MSAVSGVKELDISNVGPIGDTSGVSFTQLIERAKGTKHKTNAWDPDTPEYWPRRYEKMLTGMQNVRGVLSGMAQRRNRKLVYEWRQRAVERLLVRTRRQESKEEEVVEEVDVHSVMEDVNSEAEYRMRSCVKIVLTTTDESDGHVYIALAQVDSGRFALPQGEREESDTSTEHTAIREVREGTGIDLVRLGITPQRLGTEDQERRSCSLRPM